MCPQKVRHLLGASPLKGLFCFITLIEYLNNFNSQVYYLDLLFLLSYD
jgi:hypothetical protein